ncbi:hypothetical protein [Patiriisocius hiemis]|uniref:Histidine kinase N-terminal 7TM region domain-containing protein n=1 Tax=Patiriisocius hiemis TaxID=3075604 RepID=A0ABU2YA46_9FLAO|nr:hypothetical protein [Constantimarinum sp. W242]MDT0555064.1 hypothetical protein [Constantimarinum sp. W242]
MYSFTFVFNILEILAFIASIYFYKKHPSQKIKTLVVFLGVTSLVELVGRYALLVVDDGPLSFLDTTPFRRNYWMYNTYYIYSYSFYTLFFSFFLKNKVVKKLLKYLVVVYVFIAVTVFIVSGDFFSFYSKINSILGTLLVILSVFMYYFELLESKNILRIFKLLPFYISVGILLFEITTTPLRIYSAYYSNSIDPQFVNLYQNINYSANFFLYSIFIFGLLLCSRYKNPY